MAKATQKVASVLAGAKIGASVNQALAQNAAAPAVDSGFIDLPTGMNGAIAQLVECRFERSKPDAKQYPNTLMFRAVGIVKAPHDHEGIPVVGLRTQITELLCDTVVKSGKNAGQKTTEADHYVEVMNYLKLLSGNDNYCAHVKVASDLEPLAAQLEQAKPHFRFDTWGGGTYSEKDPATGKTVEKKSRVNSRWHGYVEFSANGSDPSGTALAGAQDQSGDADAYQQAENAEDQVAEEAAASAAQAPEELPDDPAELAAIADDGDHAQAGEAGEKLLAMAVEAGIDEDAAKAADNWSAVVDMITEATTAAEEPAAPEPKVGETWEFHTTINGKKSTKASKGKIVKVDKKNEKVTIKNLLTKKDVIVAIADLVPQA